MNPLNSITGTIVAGFVLSLIVMFGLGTTGAVNPWEFWVWMHVLAGIAWVGLLYYFNFIQVPAVGAALADADPGPAAINKYVAPRALLWFRWAAVATWVTGAMVLEAMHTMDGSGVVAAFTLQTGFATIGVGAWLGTIMMLNVWGLIWPNQKKILGLDGKEHSAEEIASAKKIALMASRTNTLLSIPMLMCMTGHAHGLPF
ncbi:urate hydroxylase PuuD [Candidatus Reidiella endopervernicosa]|nr:urate hydroxylase PuuD [Candidatus Reidiella endopervernicosa]QKQ27635.1 urate hydroxylase PuuD [Candidatus Reidiella endopervernicosa]